MTIDPKAFSVRMEQHYTENLDNIANEPLRQTWEQIAKTFNDHIRDHSDSGLATKWSVLQPRESPMGLLVLWGTYRDLMRHFE